MKLIEIQCRDADRLAPLVADFRVTLNGYRGIASQPRVEAAREEIGEFLDAGFPIFAVEDGGELAGSMVCRMDELGFGSCTNTYACEAECPKQIKRQNIARLNREWIKQLFAGNHKPANA